MSIDEPAFDPEDLLDELDSVIAAQEILQRRIVALHARYGALEPYAERYNKPNPEVDYLSLEYGSVNVEGATNRLDAAAHYAPGVTSWLTSARDIAMRIREYPQPVSEQVGHGSGNAIADAVARTSERDGVER
ncbi:hypothetical protein ACTWPB_06795 [Nocardia sp. IBHARD005]|uniref:hypothetical protein n=1 Tax=Nocardia sp. IBHARD005 TaxID=3457765 RepID=UPI0040592F87